MMAQLDSPSHLSWLARESDRLISFFSVSECDASARFLWLDDHGRPDRSRPEQLYAVARLVHCFSIEHILGRPGAGEWARAGIDRLHARFLDPTHGGFFAAVGFDGTVVSDRKETYGHAFALLAGVTAMRAGIAGGQELFEHARDVFDIRLWEEQHETALESCARDWSSTEDYRGQNGNMHLTEAYLAAFEATGEEVFAERAERIAERLVLKNAPAYEWRIPEHYTARWEVDPQYAADRPNDPFRPFGTLIGHSFEWSKLLLQLHALRPSVDWAADAARNLFDQAMADGWDAERGGLSYSVDFDGTPINTSRMHWAIAEAIGAALWLFRTTSEARYRDWYVELWRYAELNVLDLENGSWWHELDDRNNPASTTWDGKPDLYHAWQATFYARVQGNLGIAEAALRGAVANRAETTAEPLRDETGPRAHTETRDP